ncbi:MAG: hypothetical protein Q9157_003877 [Trypethelium eluteriae]
MPESDETYAEPPPAWIGQRSEEYCDLLAPIFLPLAYLEWKFSNLLLAISNLVNVDSEYNDLLTVIFLFYLEWKYSQLFAVTLISAYIEHKLNEPIPTFVFTMAYVEFDSSNVFTMFFIAATELHNIDSAAFVLRADSFELHYINFTIPVFIPACFK